MVTGTAILTMADQQ